MRDGVVYREFGNVSVASSNLEEQGRRLEDKFLVLANPVVGDARSREIVERVRTLEDLDAVDKLMRLSEAHD